LEQRAVRTKVASAPWILLPFYGFATAVMLYILNKYRLAGAWFIVAIGFLDTFYLCVFDPHNFGWSVDYTFAGVALITGRQNIAKAGKVSYFGERLILVREPEQVPIGVWHHHVFGLSPDPAAKIDVAVGLDRSPGCRDSRLCRGTRSPGPETHRAAKPLCLAHPFPADPSPANRGYHKSVRGIFTPSESAVVKRTK
jgi:hypothetical protein